MLRLLKKVPRDSINLATQSVPLTIPILAYQQRHHHNIRLYKTLHHNSKYALRGTAQNWHVATQMLIVQNSKPKDSVLLAGGLYHLHPASLTLWHDNIHHQWSYNRPASKPPTGDTSCDMSPHTKLLTYIRWQLPVTVCCQVSVLFQFYLPIFTTIFWFINHSLHHFQKHLL
jgi:hypothetical protein